jgi:RND family efflux transporter MFP subunit
MNRTNAIFSFLLISVIASLSGCSNDRSQTAPVLETIRHVPVFAVQRTNVPDLLEAVGTVRAAQSSFLAGQTMGNIVEVRAHEGDLVQRSQVLAVIDDSQPRAAMDRAIAADNASLQQLASAESDLVLADSTLKRYQLLYERKSVSPQEFDEVKARQQAALARRDMARAEQEQAKAAQAQAHTAFDYTRIRAPFDGLITERKVDFGTLVSPGMPIFTIEDVHRYRLEANINEGDLSSVHIGQSVPVLINALGSGDLKGKVVQIVPAADPDSRSFLVKIDLPAEPRLRSGLFGRAQFPRGERQSLIVPRTSIVERGQLQGVFVLDQNGVAGLRYVTLGKPLGDNVEVLAGLQPGEHLVAKPGSLELEGRRIEAEQ